MTKDEFLKLISKWAGEDHAAQEGFGDGPANAAWKLINDTLDTHWREPAAAEPNFKIDTCGSCKARIIWTITEGMRRMPVDADPPASGGNVQMVWRGTIASPRAVIIPGAGIMRAHQDGVVLRTSHFATCPNATQHRTRKAARA